MRSRKDIMTIGGYVAVLAVLGLTAASAGPTLPNLAAAAGVRLAQIGFLIFARSFGEMLGCLRESRRVPRLVGGVLHSSLLSFMQRFLTIDRTISKMHVRLCRRARTWDLADSTSTMRNSKA